MTSDGQALIHSFYLVIGILVRAAPVEWRHPSSHITSTGSQRFSSITDERKRPQIWWTCIQKDMNRIETKATVTFHGSLSWKFNYESKTKATLFSSLIYLFFMPPKRAFVTLRQFGWVVWIFCWRTLDIYEGEFMWVSFQYGFYLSQFPSMEWAIFGGFASSKPRTFVIQLSVKLESFALSTHSHAPHNMSSYRSWIEGLYRLALMDWIRSTVSLLSLCIKQIRVMYRLSIGMQMKAATE